MANLSYIKNFRFSSSAKDELGYCLTSIEAAIEYIRQGSLSVKPVRAPSCSALSLWVPWCVRRDSQGGMEEEDQRCSPKKMGPQPFKNCLAD